jgi:hypothetical protein
MESLIDREALKLFLTIVGCLQLSCAIVGCWSLRVQIDRIGVVGSLLILILA